MKVPWVVSSGSKSNTLLGLSLIWITPPNSISHTGQCKAGEGLGDFSELRCYTGMLSLALWFFCGEICTSGVFH